ncbi:unnamed protein product [Rhizophagus irregularis]|nr:unnamed protein product [Rhizophagus irregularis]
MTKFNKINIDCFNLIINELRMDKRSLRSCLLVNKEWCNIAVPILWKNHSWCNEDKPEKLFTAIFSCLPSSSKQILSDYNIKLPSTKSPLFNYVSFCEFPKPKIINKIIGIVLKGRYNREILYDGETLDYGKTLYDNEKLDDREELDDKEELDEKNILEREIYKLFVEQCKGVKELCWETSQPLPLFPGALTCFSQLSSLDVDVDFVNSDVLYEMAQICRNLNRLTINNCSQDLPGLISLIDAQKNLKNVSLYPAHKKGTCKELSKALARKGSMINNLYLGPIGSISPSFLTSLINLKGITIYEGDDIRKEIVDFQRYLAISQFPDLQYISIVGLSCFKELAQLIEKTRGSISEISLFTFNRFAENTGLFIKAIANNCPKIKSLPIYLRSEDFIHVKSLLLNCKYLEDIKFYGLASVITDDNIGDELLDILTEFSPNLLTKILLSGSWNYSINAFERFFESHREKRPLSIFEIRNISEENKVIVRKYIKEVLWELTIDEFNAQRTSDYLLLVWPVLILKHQNNSLIFCNGSYDLGHDSHEYLALKQNSTRE